MRRYTSGAPRVHSSMPEAEILAAIEEYERLGPDIPDLGPELLECARDLREELDLRKAEPWRST